PVNAKLIGKEILKLRDQGATVLFSTHRMESVEEMCDHIALIHQSNKLLDGEISSIKRAYQSNIYQVGIQSDNLQNVKKKIEENYKILPTNFKSIHQDELQLNVQIPENVSANQLLTFLINLGWVNHFSEVIPSINDIFI